MDKQNTQDNQTYSTTDLNDKSIKRESSLSLQDNLYLEENALRSLNRETSIQNMISEQARRIVDQEGESLKRITGKKVADMFNLYGKADQTSGTSIRVAVREALKRAGSRISIGASEAKESLEYSITANSNLLDYTFAEIKESFKESTAKATEIVTSIGVKGNQAAQNASYTGAELALSGKTGLDLLLHHARDFLKDSVINLSKGIQKKWEGVVLQSHLNFTTHLEKREQKRRTTSDAEETFAVLNAMKMSSLIKDLAPEFYRPSEEPNRSFAIDLLETKERNRRVAEDNKALRLRFKQLADLAMEYHAARAPKELLPVYTIESVIHPPPKVAEHIKHMQIFEEPRRLSEILEPSEMPAKHLTEATTATVTARCASM